MPGQNKWTCRIAFAWMVLAIAGSSLAAQPSQRLLPDTTKGYLSVPDVYELEASWDKTQLGQLLNDPVMNGFGEDLKAQLKKKFTRLRDRIGITLDDLEDVPGGEVAIGMIQPAKEQSALAVLVDITDHREQADELLAKIERNMEEKKAKRVPIQVGETEVIHYTIPKQDEEQTREREAVFFIHNNVLCGCDNKEIALKILNRFSGEPTDTLENLPAYRAVMTRCHEAAGDLAPQLRWFVDPFGYAECMRATDLPRKERKGNDHLVNLSAEGFDAVRAIGGYVNLLAEDKYEILHRTSIYAPAVENPDVEGDKYNRAMRMMKFPNGGQLDPFEWIPRELATYISFNLDVQNAFDKFETLFDAYTDPGAWKDVFEGIATDPHGPKIDVRDELVAHLGSRAVVISDYELPITPKCERLLFAVDVVDLPALESAIQRTMESDPNCEVREFNGHTIWEIVEPEENLEGLDLELEGPGFDIIGAEEDEPEEAEKVQNLAVSVAHGHLLAATNIDILKKALSDPKERETLAASADYQVVRDELGHVGDSEISFRFFSRTDEEYRPTYELIRQGRMPEAESLFGKLLNRMLTEDEDEDVLREQVIDGSKLPEFEMVRRYFGPVGATIRSEENGWFVTGFALNKETPQPEVEPPAVASQQDEEGADARR